MSYSILIIEDDINIAKFIKFSLEKKGYEVNHIDNGIDGIEALKERQPDLVILDMMMPGIDGREVVERVKEEEIIDPNRIIILSGKEVTDELKAMFDLGINNYLKKPFNINNLIVRIENALESFQEQ